MDNMDLNQNIKPELLDKLTKVCLCKGISRATIKKSIINGAKTIEEVKKTTGAGSGSCGGKHCTPKIQQFLEELK